MKRQSRPGGGRSLDQGRTLSIRAPSGSRSRRSAGAEGVRPKRGASMAGRAIAWLQESADKGDRRPALATLTCSTCGRPLRRCAGCRTTTCSGPWCLECLVNRMDLPPAVAQAVLEPPRVLPGQTQDQIADLGPDRRTSWLPAPCVGPLSSYQFSVPANERLGGHHERHPPIPVEDPAHRGEEHPVERLELRPARLAFQHAHLVSEHQDLQVLGAVVPPMVGDHPGECPDHEGQEEEHRGMVEEPPFEARTWVSDPYAQTQVSNGNAVTRSTSPLEASYRHVHPPTRSPRARRLCVKD